MRTTWERTTNHVGTVCGHDTSNELLDKTPVVMPTPEHTQEVLDKHKTRVVRLRVQEQQLAAARTIKQAALEASVVSDHDAPMALAMLDNEIDEAAFEATIDIPIKLNDEEKTAHSNAWRTHPEQKNRLIKQ